MSASEVAPSSRPPMANELYAAGRIIGNKCFDENLDFMKCKQSKGEGPTACAAEGEEKSAGVSGSGGPSVAESVGDAHGEIIEHSDVLSTSS